MSKFKQITSGVDEVDVFGSGSSSGKDEREKISPVKKIEEYKILNIDHEDLAELRDKGITSIPAKSAFGRTKISFETVLKDSEKGDHIGSNYSKDNAQFASDERPADINKEQVYFIIVEEKAYYVGSLKDSNTKLNKVLDYEMLNINASISVRTPSLDSDSMRLAGFDRLERGVQEDYQKIRDKRSNQWRFEDKKVIDWSRSSFRLLTTIAADTVDYSELRDKIQEMSMTVEAFSDHIMYQFQQYEGAIDEDKKKSIMLLHLKDIARIYFNKLNPGSSDDEVKEMMEMLFIMAGVMPASDLNINASLVATSVMRSDEKQPGFDAYYPESKVNRSFLIRMDRTIPITPQILIDNQELITEMKHYLVQGALYLQQKMIESESEMEWPKVPKINVQKYTLGNLTKEEFDKFQRDILPGLVREASDSYQTKKALALAGQTEVRKPREVKEEAIEDNFDEI